MIFKWIGLAFLTFAVIFAGNYTFGWIFFIWWLILAAITLIFYAAYVLIYTSAWENGRVDGYVNGVFDERNGLAPRRYGLASK